MHFSQLAIQILLPSSLCLQLWKILSLNTLSYFHTHINSPPYSPRYIYLHTLIHHQIALNTSTYTHSHILTLCSHSYIDVHTHTLPSHDTIMLLIKYFVHINIHMHLSISQSLSILLINSPIHEGSIFNISPLNQCIYYQ